MERKRRIILSCIFAVISVLLLSCIFILAYLGSYSHANDSEINKYLAESNIEKRELDRSTTAFVPSAPLVGFIFYPGGKVEAEAYYPLMAECAKNGILSVICQMPFNLAVFDIDAANGIKEKFPEIDSWYIGGHSLGGSMAASYFEKNISDLDGLILLGSYSTADLSSSNASVLSIYGENDRVMNRKKYEENKKNLPSNTQEYIIKGGNHAGFGMYGHQIGDGDANITNEAQILKTAEQIFSFINK